MRKLILLLLLITVTSCASVNSEYTCEFENESFKDNTILYVTNDNITRLEATYTNRMQDLGYSDSRVATIIKENTNKYQNSEYISYKATYFDGILVENQTYEISSMSPELLKETGLIASTSDELSLSKSLETYEENGYTCK